jgi:hypothetical protein
VLPIVGQGEHIDRLVLADACVLAASHSDADNATYQGWQSPLSDAAAQRFNDPPSAARSSLRSASRSRDGEVLRPHDVELAVDEPTEEGSQPLGQMVHPTWVGLVRSGTPGDLPIAIGRWRAGPTRLRCWLG